MTDSEVLQEIASSMKSMDAKMDKLILLMKTISQKVGG